MIALEILEIKKFMNAFLLGDLFDRFRMTEAQITTFCTFTIDGRLEKAFFGEEEEKTVGGAGQAGADCVTWELIKPRCLDLIRGKKTPLSFRFVFFCPEETMEELLSAGSAGEDAGSVTGMCLNLRFSGGTLSVTTGIARRLFSTDRAQEMIWDDYVREFLKTAGIACREIA